MTNRPNLPEDHQDPYTPDEADPDWQYSEARGYSDWEAPRRNWMRIAVIAVSLLVLLSMALPMLMMFGTRR